MNKVVDAVKKVVAPKKEATPKVEVAEEVRNEVRDAEFLKRHTGARDGVIYE